jgi:Phospholipase_D-nuclease N-terminal
MGRLMHVEGFFVVLWLLGLVLVIWALVDAIQVPDDAMYQSGSKIVWVLVIVLLNFIGAIIYFVIGRPTQGSRDAASRRSGSMPPPPPPPPG